MIEWLSPPCGRRSCDLSPPRASAERSIGGSRRSLGIYRCSFPACANSHEIKNLKPEDQSTNRPVTNPDIQLVGVVSRPYFTDVESELDMWLNYWQLTAEKVRWRENPLSARWASNYKSALSPLQSWSKFLLKQKNNFCVVFFLVYFSEKSKMTLTCLTVGSWSAVWVACFF